MNEMKMLAALGEHLDEGAPADLHRQRRRVLQAAHAPRRRTGGIPRLRLVLTAGLLTGAAAAGLVVAGTGSDHRKAMPGTIQLAGASVLLGQAARAVSEQPYTVPKPQQWIYMKVAVYGVNSGGHPTFHEDWIRFDGRQEADVQGGKVVVSTHRGGADGDEGTPQGAAALLRSLPTDPRALIAVLAERVGAEPRGDAAPGRDGLLFANIVQLIRDAPAGIPPKTQAALYRAIATLHGVRVDENVVDGLGRKLIGVTQGTTGHFVLIDPATHRIAGFQNVWSGRPTPTEVTMAKDKKLNVDLPKGTVTYGLVTVATAVVDHPGQR